MRLLSSSRSAPFLLVAAALSLSACGSEDEGKTKAGKAPAAGHSSGHSGAAASEGASLDRAFVAAMIPHHESAIEMAEVAADRAEGPFVNELAANILASQQQEIDVMRAADKRLATDNEVGELGAPGHKAEDLAALREAKDFDVAFVKMMLPHHESAIPMAQAEVDKGVDAELKRVAADIIEVQEREIAEMKAFLADAGETASGSQGSAHSTPSTSGANQAHAEDEAE